MGRPGYGARWCPLRAQVVPLVELAGRPSRAQEAYCVFCAALVRAPVHHVLGDCPWWAGHRRQVLEAAGDVPGDTLRSLLLVLSPPRVARACAMAFADAIDKAAREFWARMGIHP